MYHTERKMSKIISTNSIPIKFRLQINIYSKSKVSDWYRSNENSNNIAFKTTLDILKITKL